MGVRAAFGTAQGGRTRPFRFVVRRIGKHHVMGRAYMIGIVMSRRRRVNSACNKQ